MLEECGLPYKATKIDLEKGEQKTPNYLKINPSGQIPALIDPDRPGGKPLVVAQSGAIILYLVDKTNKLMPRDPVKRALAQQWFLQAMSDVAPASGILFVVGTIPEVTTSTRKLFEQRLINQLRNADRRLGEAEFLAGELSIADIALFPTVSFRRELIEQHGELRHLIRWIATMSARPAVQRGMKVPA